MSLIEDVKAKVLELHEKAKASSRWSTDVRWYDVIDELELEEVDEQVVERSRWMTTYTTVVRRGDEFVRFTHEAGSTEMQDSVGAQDELDTLVEVVPVEKTVVVYVRKN